MQFSVDTSSSLIMAQSVSQGCCVIQGFGWLVSSVVLLLLTLPKLEARDGGDALKKENTNCIARLDKTSFLFKCLPFTFFRFEIEVKF